LTAEKLVKFLIVSCLMVSGENLMIQNNNSMFNQNKFKLGVFSPNCSGGMAITKVSERWDASWKNNLGLAKMLDDAGIEFILPIARWTGYGGETDFQGSNLETITWCTALLSATDNITIFATAHASFHHPIVAAKMFATMDQVSEGRFGLNIVCGWNKHEYEMFNIELADSHKVRYGYGQEWFDIINKIWTSDAQFDWSGDYFDLKHVYGNPKPYGLRVPPIMNAGSSEQGQQFAAKNADYLFTVLIDLESGKEKVSAIKAKAKGFGREIGVFTTSYVVCRETQKEAEEYHEYYSNEQADWPAVDRLMELQGLHSKSFPPEAFTQFRNRFAAGHGVYPLVGNPDYIAAEMERIHDAGFDGSTITFVNYTDEFPFFRDEVLPRLQSRGLRK